MKTLLLLNLFFALFSMHSTAQSWLSECTKGDSLFQQQKYKQALPIYEKALELGLKEFGESSENYLKTRITMGSCYIFSNDIANGKAFLQNTLAIAEKHFANKALHAKALHELAVLLQKDFNSAIPLLQKALSIRKAIGDENADYIGNIGFLGILLMNAGRYDESELYMLKNQELCKKSQGIKSIEYARAVNNLGNLYYEQESFEKALEYYLLAYEIRKEILPENSPEYTSSISNLGVAYKRMGQFALAEKYYRESLELRAKHMGINSLAYARSQNNIASLYSDIGSTDAAITLLTDCLEKFKTLAGESSVEYSTALGTLAKCYRYQKKYDLAEPLYLKGLEIRKKTVGTEHPLYARSLNALGNFYSDIGQYSKADSLYRISLAIAEKTKGKGEEYATILSNLGLIRFNLKDYETALTYYNQSLEIQLKTLAEDHPDIGLIHGNLALVYMQLGKQEMAYKLFEKSINTVRKQINTLFPILSEDEKLNFIESAFFQFTKYCQFAIYYSNQQQEHINTLYNQIIHFKGIVFSSTMRTKQIMLESSDTLLKKDYLLWTQKKQELADFWALPLEEQAKYKLESDSLQQQIYILEKGLSSLSEKFAKGLPKVYTWQDIQQKLGPKEVLIELLHVLLPKNDSSEILENKYLVFFLTKNMHKGPEFIVLDDGNKMNKEYYAYYKTAIHTKKEDKASFTKYWKAIDQKLKSLSAKGFDKVYMCPDGIYHNINCATLKNPASQKYVLDEHALVLLASSKDLINNKTTAEAQYKGYQAFLFGYPQYDVQSQSTDANPDEQRSINSLQASVLSGKLSMLPGTKKEVEAIEELCRKKGMQVSHFIGTEATEENLKKIQNPLILHVATHGFFLPPPQTTEVASALEAEKNKLMAKPYLRSGLLLAGCENAKPKQEDGILTSFEALGLNLDKTELVVLSACETALGDQVDGEGVFGLPRAFMQAGAKCIVMSLWKVSDEATQVMMENFYKNLLSKGQSKTEAFRNAQKKLRENYPDPYYWGAFVLVGE